MSSGERFKDKVAVVTGGCSGIGRGCADVLADHGGKVVVLDVDDEVGTKLNQDDMYYIRCDMAKETEIKNAIVEVVNKYGRIDCLVNNVGHRQTTNVVFQYALPHLRKTNGSIVNISSVSGHVGTAKCSTYCATKGGVISLTKALAIDEAKYGVRANALCPSTVNTPLYHKAVLEGAGDAEKAAKLSASFNLLNRIAEPREMGMACLFLDVDATFTTGEELMCTGGYEIGYGVKLLSNM